MTTKKTDPDDGADTRTVISLQAYRELRARATVEKQEKKAPPPTRTSLNFAVLIGFVAALGGVVHLHEWVYQQSQFLWLGGWVVFLVLAALVYDWLWIELPLANFALTAAIFAAAIFTSLAWPYALILVLILLARRVLGPMVI